LSKHEKIYRVYAVRFTDNRIKFGVSGNIHKRMRYYVQEARRNRVDGVVWYASAPFTSKRDALNCESMLASLTRYMSIPGHREWIDADAGFYPQVIEFIQFVHKNIYGEMDTRNGRPDMWGHVFGLKS
jgi:predicted GIY-YIG superfamily endonuclease